MSQLFRTRDNYNMGTSSSNDNAGWVRSEEREINQLLAQAEVVYGVFPPPTTRLTQHYTGCVRRPI